MSRVAYIRAWPRDPATGVAGLVTMAGGGAHLPYILGNTHYRAGIVREPRFSAGLGFGETGWTGAALPTISVIEFAPGDPALLRAYQALYWKDAPIEVDAGPEMTGVGRILTGVIADATVQDDRLMITVADFGVKLAKPLIQSWFAGTGGIEGDASAEGRVKRRSFGAVLNVEGRLLNAANNIYEFGNPAYPLQNFTAVRDMGREGPTYLVDWQGSVAATLNALIAAPAQQGGAMVAPSIACVKWWTQPAGPLTADIQGENAGGYAQTPVSIAARILAAANGPAIVNQASADALRSFSAGLHIGDDSETAASALDRLLLPVSLFWRFGTTGQIDIRPWDWNGDAEVVQGRYIGRTKTLAPTKTRRLGYARNHRQHSEGEIAADILAAGVAYADGTSLEQLKPAEGGANVTGNHSAAAFAGQGALATRNDVIFGSHITSLPAAIAPGNLIGGQYLSAGFARYLDNVTVQALRPGEANANVTEGRVASAIAGQGAFATISSAAYGSSLLTGFGALSPLSSIAFGSSYLLESIGGALATLGNFKTNVGTAAGIVGQTAWATYSRSISSVAAPKANLFRYPRPTADGRAPSAYGFAVHDPNNGGWGAIWVSDNSALGGKVYVLSRTGGPAGAVYPYADTALAFSGAEIVGISLGGYVSNGTANFYAEFYDDAWNFVPGTIPLAYNSNTRRHEGTGQRPAGATRCRVVFCGTFAASPAYQDIVFYDIKIEFGPDGVTPFVANSQSVLTNVEWGNGLLLNLLRPGEANANVTEGRVASGITGQSGWATYSGLTTQIVEGRIQNLQNDGNLQSTHIYQAGAGALSLFWPQEAGANITEGRVASAIAGQGALATQSVVTVAQQLGSSGSLCPDPQFSDEAFWASPLDPGGWYFEQLSQSVHGLEAKAVTLFAGYANPGDGRRHVWSAIRPLPAGLGTKLVLRAVHRNNCNQIIFAEVKFLRADYSETASILAPSAAQSGIGLQTASGTVPTDAKYYRFVIFNNSFAPFEGAASVTGVTLNPASVYSDGTLADALRPLEFGANITESRVSSGITGQSGWATYFGLSTITVEQRTQKLQTDGNIESNAIYKANVGQLFDWWPQEPNANMTEGRTAAAFNGQGALATRSNIGWDDSLFTGRPQYLTDVVDRPGYAGEKALRADYITQAGSNVALVNRWPQEAGANVTEGRTAAAFNGQGALATQSWINSGNVASFFAYSAFRLSYNITRFDGSTIVTETMVLTSEGISAGFVGQGVGATANNLAQLDPTAQNDINSLKGGQNIFGYGEIKKVYLAAGASVGLSGVASVNAGGSGGGTIRAQLVAGPAGSGRSAFATGTNEPVSASEPASSSVSGTFTNNTGTAQLFEFTITLVRTPASAGGAVNSAQSYFS